MRASSTIVGTNVIRCGSEKPGLNSDLDFFHWAPSVNTMLRAPVTCPAKSIIDSCFLD